MYLLIILLLITISRELLLDVTPVTRIYQTYVTSNICMYLIINLINMSQATPAVLHIKRSGNIAEYKHS